MSPVAASSVTTAQTSEPQSAALQAYIAGKPFNSKWNAYYSRVVFQTQSGVAGTSAFTVLAGTELLGFGYSRGTDMGPAGLAGTIATYADTNIQTPSQTVAGEALEITGVGLIVLGATDAQLLKALDQNTSVKIRMNGATDFPMGIPSMLPGPGGLFGTSEAASVAPPQQAPVAIQIGMMTNGLPHIGNFYPIPEPLVWASAGKADSTLNVILKSERQTITNVNYQSAARAAVAGGADTPGTAAYTPPVFGVGVSVQYMIVMVGRTINPESDN
jgi:hypothetical protein